MEPVNLFDPSIYAKVRLPLREAETLPNFCYTSDRFYEREVDRIFMKTWNFVGRTDEVPNPGDYIATDDLAGGPVVVIRGKDNILRAFANSCRHRGARLLKDKGNCRAVICPYHSWVYDLQGGLIGSSGMEETTGFDRAEFGLIPIRLEIWGGFLFVNFDKNTKGLSAYLGNLPEEFASYNFDDMVCTRRKEYELAANWKLYLENIEVYHTTTVHKGSFGTQRADIQPTKGDWDALHMPGDETCAILAGEGTPFPQISTLAGKPKKGTFFTLIYPNALFSSTHDCFWWTVLYPKGPGRSKLSLGFCFPKSTVALPNFSEMVQPYYNRWDLSIPEDDAAVEAQHAGLLSRVRGPGRLSTMEPMVSLFDNWVLDQVLDESTPRLSHANRRAALVPA
jgi:choline monooxygenase